MTRAFTSACLLIATVLGGAAATTLLHNRVVFPHYDGGVAYAAYHHRPHPHLHLLHHLNSRTNKVHLQPLSYFSESRTPHSSIASVQPDRRSSASVTTLHSLHLRGGDIASYFESIPTTSTFATLLTIYALVSGVLLVSAPVTYSNSALNSVIPDIERDSFESSLLQSIGAIIIGFAIHIYLTLVQYGTGDVSISHAMGYALLPRIFMILWSFLHKMQGEYFFHASKFLKINFVMMSWTAFSLLAGLGNSDVSTKVFSTMALLKAMALVTRPVAMTEKIFGVNVSGEEMAKARFLSRVLGNYLAVSAILMMTLAYGLSPVMAAGVSSCLWFALLFDMAFVSKTWEWLEGGESPTGKKLFHMVVAGVASFVFLRGG